MPSRGKFTVPEDDAIIEYVKARPNLYNQRDVRYRDTYLKSQQWEELAAILGRDGACVCVYDYKTTTKHRCDDREYTII